MGRTPYEHVHRSDPLTDWHFGPMGWLARYRGIATWIGGHLTVGGVVNTLFKRPEVLWGFGGLAISGGLSLYWMRSFLLRHSKSNIRFHEFSHSIRDSVAERMKVKEDAVQRICQIAAQQIALFFRDFKGDPTVTCAIRVASLAPDSDGTSPAQRQYQTVGRSDLLDPTRQRQSKPIPQNEGLIAVLMEKGQQGAILVPSISEAIKEGVYLRTPNDGFADCSSLAICPINSLENGRPAMIAAVSVHSKKPNAFNPADTPPLMGFADQLGLILPIVLEKTAGVSQNKKSAS